MRQRFPALAVVGILCALGLLVLAPGREPVRRPRLVVLAVVDQMRYDYLTRFADLYRGGFRTLLDRGAVFTNARFEHAATLTAPGHAAIATGLHPSHSGMAANSWFDAATGEGVNCVFDPSEKPVGGPGRQASPRTLFADTFGDRLKEKNPESRVVGISMKDRAAILMAGRQGDGVYWFSDRCGCFVTSSYYAAELPAWLRAFNDSKPADRYAAKPWERLFSDPDLYQEYAREDAFPAEFDGEHLVFPHALRKEPPERRFYQDLVQSAFGDELLLAAALAAIEGHQLGADEVPDVLAIGFSGTDRVGHAFGPFSQEAMDQLLRLDRLLATLFEAIDQRVGLEETVIVLSADHGAAPLVEQAQKQGIPAKRVPKRGLEMAVDRALRARFPGAGEMIAFEDRPHLFLDLETLADHGIERGAAERVAREALLATGFVDQVYTHEDMRRPAPPNDPFWKLYRNSFYEPRSPHLMVRLKKHYYFGSSGTGHGSPHDYDRHVPLIFMGDHIPAGRYENVCGPHDIAPTLGRMLGVKMPVEPDGRVLREVLR